METLVRYVDDGEKFEYKRVKKQQNEEDNGKDNA
jgi:hypothetical protein